jgi:acetyl esterase/lipase
MFFVRPLAALFFAAAAAFAADAPKEIPLWPLGAPGSEGKTEPEKVVTSGSGERNVSSIHNPTITPYLPAAGKGNGAAMLVIPGGGHSKLCVDHEGVNIAQWLADRGIAAFVLKHRLAREQGSTYTIEGHALPDTQRAIQFIRSRAKEWSIDPMRLGAMGFSAGGELVALAWMRPNVGKPESTDPVEVQDSSPAFQALIYPGRSGDIVPTKDAPPAFLLCGEKDRKDISEGLAEVYLRFKRAGASAEFHVYADAGHGFGFRSTMKPPVASWPERMLDWMNAKGFTQAGN